jgi:hypothetical protein
LEPGNQHQNVGRMLHPDLVHDATFRDRCHRMRDEFDIVAQPRRIEGAGKHRPLARAATRMIMLSAAFEAQ